MQPCPATGLPRPGRAHGDSASRDTLAAYAEERMPTSTQREALRQARTGQLTEKMLGCPPRIASTSPRTISPSPSQTGGQVELAKSTQAKRAGRPRGRRAGRRAGGPAGRRAGRRVYLLTVNAVQKISPAHGSQPAAGRPARWAGRPTRQACRPAWLASLRSIPAGRPGPGPGARGPGSGRLA